MQPGEFKPTNPLLDPKVVQPTPTPTGPRVDDQFWFDWSYEYVKNSLDNIDKNIASIDKLVLWAYSIYTSSTIITLVVKQITNGCIVTIMALPYLFLIGSYWLTNARLIEEKASIIGNIPDKIVEAYRTVYTQKLWNLRITKVGSFLGVFCMAITLMIAFVYGNRKQEADPSLVAKIIVDSKNGRQLSVTGHLPKNINLFFTISRHKKSTKLDSLLSIYSTRVNTPTGDYMTSFPLTYSMPDSAHKYTVRVEWNDSLYTRALQKTILITKPVQSTISIPGMTTIKPN